MRVVLIFSLVFSIACGESSGGSDGFETGDQTDPGDKNGRDSRDLGNGKPQGRDGDPLGSSDDAGVNPSKNDAGAPEGTAEEICKTWQGTCAEYLYRVTRSPEGDCPEEPQVRAFDWTYAQTREGAFAAGSNYFPTHAVDGRYVGDLAGTADTTHFRLSGMGARRDVEIEGTFTLAGFEATETAEGTSCTWTLLGDIRRKRLFEDGVLKSSTNY